MSRIFCTFLFAILISGCAAEYATDSFSAPKALLDRAATAYVAMPEDGRYGSTLYPGSGKQTALALYGAILKFAPHAVMAEKHEGHAAALAKARSIGAAYLFESVIINWEDRATEWSGITDKLAIRLVVYDTATGRDVTDTIAKAHSSFWTLGGDHPQDLLPVTFDRFAKSIYQGNG